MVRTLKIVVFTDLDATLLDPYTYSWEPARPALEALRRRQASIVLVSSKTFSEMSPLHGQLALRDPFVVENGGGVMMEETSREARFFRRQGFSLERAESEGFVQLPLGPSYEMLTRALSEMAAELGCDTRGFAALSNAEIAELTGLPLEEANKARRRNFDEPFLIVDGNEDCEVLLCEAAALRGLTVVRGGRFLHLIGHEGKGRAVSLLIAAYRDQYDEMRTMGLGDSPNDFSFLELVDFPVLVGVSPDSPPVWRCPCNVRTFPEAGPRAWNSAVLAALAEIGD